MQKKDIHASNISHLDSSIDAGWHNRRIIEETEWSTSGSCPLEADVPSLAPASSPGIFDFPEIGSIARCQNSMVQRASRCHTTQNSTAVALKFAVSIHHHCDSTGSQSGGQ